MTSYVRGVLDLTLLVATLAGAAVGNGLPPIPAFNLSSLLSSLPQPREITGQSLPPKPELPFATEAGLELEATEEGLRSFGSEDLPTRPEDNTSPSFRAEQLIAVMQQEMVTGLTRDTIPFTTVLTPDPRNTDLPTTDFIPVYHYGHGRKLLDAAGRVQQPADATALPHSRGLKQRYAYDARGRLQYAPQNGAIGSFDFQFAFNTAIANLSATGLVLTPGSYQVVANLNGNPAHLAMLCNNRQQPFEVDLTGSTLTFQNVDYGGIYISGCANLNLHGPATLTYATAALGFTQGTLTYVGQPNSAGQVIIVLRIDLGYPVSTLLFSGATLLAIAFDPTSGLLTTNTSDVYLPDPYYYAVDGAGSSYLYYQTYSQFNIRFGTRLAVRGLRGTHMISSSGNNFTTCASLRIETANEFAVASGGGSANRFLNNVVAPRATPFPGTGNVPLLSSVADGIHASEELVGPTLNNNTILNNGDDAVALEGTYYLVSSTQPAQRTITISVTYFKAAISIGDTIAAFTNVSRPLGTARVTNVTTIPIPPEAAAQGSSSTAVYDYTDATSTHLLVTLATWPVLFNQLVLDSLISNPSRNCAGFQVVNNYVGLNRGRGIISKASNGVITGNTVLLPKLPGLMMVPDLFFQEADFVQNVTITGNTITAERGGIQIANFLPGFPTYPGAYPNHASLTISNNVLNGSSFTPMLITSATNVTICSNVFLNNFCFEYTYQDQTFPFVLQGSLVALSNVQNIRGTGNRISNPARCGYQASTPYVASGFHTGVTCC